MILEMEMFGWINPPILETGGKLDEFWRCLDEKTHPFLKL